MATNKQIRKAVTFEECNQLTACPYCKAPVGKPCSSRYQGKPSSDPHRSRGLLALRKAEKQMKKMRQYQ